MNGEQVARILHEQYPALKILALGGYGDRQFVRALIKAGVAGYVVKSASGRELIKALRAVANGQSYLSPEVAGTVMNTWHDTPTQPGVFPQAALGPRE
jgi:DNA-binding NarL/FixJ family response regulator